MSVMSGRERPTAEGVVSGFVDAEAVALLEEAISQATVSALATDLLAFWPPAKPPFILSLFEEKPAFERAVPRLAGMAATGATVVVGAPAKMHRIPPGIFGVDLRGTDDLIDARSQVVLEASFAAALVAVRSDVISLDDDDAEVLYNARWTFRRARVVDAMQQLLRPLRPVLPDSVLASADAAILRAGEVVISASESNLLGVLENLSAGLVRAPVLTPVVPQEPNGPRIVRED